MSLAQLTGTAKSSKLPLLQGVKKSVLGPLAEHSSVLRFIPLIRRFLDCERCPCWLTGGRNTALLLFLPKERYGNVGFMTG